MKTLENERVHILTEIGRHVGNNIIAEIINSDMFKEIIKHERHHVLIFNKFNIESFTRYYIFFPGSDIFCGGVALIVGKPSFLRRILSAFVQSLFDIRDDIRLTRVFGNITFLKCFLNIPSYFLGAISGSYLKTYHEMSRLYFEKLKQDFKKKYSHHRYIKIHTLKIEAW
jgi:hypothetical protein